MEKHKRMGRPKMENAKVVNVKIRIDKKTDEKLYEYAARILF